MAANIMVYGIYLQTIYKRIDSKNYLISIPKYLVKSVSTLV